MRTAYKITTGLAGLAAIGAALLTGLPSAGAGEATAGTFDHTNLLEPGGTAHGTFFDGCAGTVGYELRTDATAMPTFVATFAPDPGTRCDHPYLEAAVRTPVRPVVTKGAQGDAAGSIRLEIVGASEIRYLKFTACPTADPAGCESYAFVPDRRIDPWNGPL